LALTRLQNELRDARNELSYQREQIKGRETHIAELRTTLAEREITIEQLRAQLAHVRAAEPQLDDLKRIRGIGPGFERVLHEAGVTAFASIASWTSDDIAKIAALLRTQPARIQRGQWVEQARVLAGVAAG
jgi:predicted flap endonuclease-1-like 5' DNA nuclease